MKSLSPSQKKDLVRGIKAGGTYSKAYEDMDFMNRKELRPVRLQLELLKPELMLREQRVRSTIVVFGSARVPSPEEAKAKLAECRKRSAARPSDKGLKKNLALAKLQLAQSRYYTQARLFAQLASRRQKRGGDLELVVVTGGGPGIMEAANRGAYELGAKSAGLNITLPHEQDPNAYISPELCFQFHYFSLRKMHFMMRAKALVAFPGGFGTCDELFEALTLVQTGKKAHLPVVLVGKSFWKRLINFKFLAEQAMISTEDLKLFKVVETAEQAWRHIEKHWRSHSRSSGET